MILLDTSVLSALMRAPPDARVVDWLDEQASREVWTTSISIFEVRFGLARLAPSRRADALRAAFEALLHDELLDRVASVDRMAADAAGALAADRERRGRTVDFRDTLIAGIALARDAAIATRNVRHFEDCGARVIDPWGLAPA